MRDKSVNPFLSFFPSGALGLNTPATSSLALQDIHTHTHTDTHTYTYYTHTHTHIYTPY